MERQTGRQRLLLESALRTTHLAAVLQPEAPQLATVLHQLYDSLAAERQVAWAGDCFCAVSTSRASSQGEPCDLLQPQVLQGAAVLLQQLQEGV